MNEKTSKLIENLSLITQKLNQNCMLKDLKYRYENVIGAEKKDFDDTGFVPITHGLVYHKSGDVLWIRFRVDVPEKIHGVKTEKSQIRIMSVFQAPVEVYVDGQLVIKEENWSDFRFPEVVLTESAKKGDFFTIAMKIKTGEAAFSRNPFFVESFASAVDAVRFDLDVFINELKYTDTLENAQDILEKIVELVYKKSQKSVDEESEILKLLDMIHKSREIAEPLRGKSKSKKLHLVGHAHIDMNWLWDMKETIDLIKRDFTTVCNIMDEFPAFKFSQSQCAVYEIAEKNFPSLFQRVSDKIKNGQWDITANAWVENDNNMASGEDIARHILYSKKYIFEKFAKEPKIMWCPDTFGHSANLPQILKKGGIDNYFFMRCGKEDTFDSCDRHYYGRTVSDTPIFKWKGLDGSEVLAANLEYNGEFSTDKVIRNMQSAVKSGLDDALLVYGVGDHGGAPTKRDVSRAIAANNSPMLPQIQFSATEEYYSSIRKQNMENLPIHTGEMNFVFEGCYTTHADIKKHNRMMENKLYQAETICLLASKNGMPYPYEELCACWKTLMFHQFHDIFDGCAKTNTYIQAIGEMQASLNKLESLIKRAEGYLLNVQSNAISIYNSLPFERNEIIKLDLDKDSRLTDENGQDVVMQYANDGMYAYVTDIPAFGFKQICVEAGEQKQTAKGIGESETHFIIDTNYYHVLIKKNSGEITTLYDYGSKRFLAREGRDCWRSKRGTLNTLAIYEEMPEFMSAWVVGQTQKVTYLINDAESLIKTDGEVVKILSFKHQYRNSVINQNIVFDMHSPVIRFDTKVEWQEAGSVSTCTPALRAVFAPEIENASVVNEIPYGSIKRSCKSGEYPQLRWSAVNDEKGGFALLNNCKYGIHSVGNELALTLLRSGWDPDTTADIGNHSFSYAIYCFGGKLEDSDVLREAEKFNINPLIFANQKLKAIRSVLPNMKIPSNISISAIKAAEDYNGFVIRLFESFGIPTTIQLLLDYDVKRIVETDINESLLVKEFPVSNGCFVIPFEPYELKTLKIFVKE